METLRNNIKVVELLPVDVYDDDADGAAFDMHADQGFETILAMASIGAITGTPDAVELSFVESDNADLSSSSVMEGGAATELSADSAETFELRRTKRYVGAVLAFTGGTTPTAEVAVQGLLTNWAIPMPLV